MKIIKKNISTVSSQFRLWFENHGSGRPVGSWNWGRWSGPEYSSFTILPPRYRMLYFSISVQSSMVFWINSLVVYGVCPPAKKVGMTKEKLFGPLVSCVSSTKLQYTCMGPPIYKTLFNGFAQISGGVWTEVGGPDPPIPPVARPVATGGEHLKLSAPR